MDIAEHRAWVNGQASSTPGQKYPFTAEEYGGLAIHSAVLRGIPEVVLKLVEVRISILAGLFDIFGLNGRVE